MPVTVETLAREHGDTLPHEALERFRAGVSMLQSDMHELAIGQFENLLQMMRSHPAAWAVRWNLGEALHYSRQFAPAVEQFDLALQQKPNEAGLYYTRGNALAGLGRFDDSVASLRKAAELEPGNAMIQHHLGMALFDLGQRQEAVTVLLNASKSLEENARAACLVRAAAGLMEQGQQDPAQECLADAWTALKNDTGDEWVRAGLALSKAGAAELARPFLEQALKRTPCREASEMAAEVLGVKLPSPWTSTPLGPAPLSYDELQSTVVDDDGHHIAFLTERELAVDDQRIPRNTPDIANLIVSSQGSWAAAMPVKGKWYAVRDGNPVGGPFDQPPNLVFSASGTLAVVTSNQVLLDGVAGPKFDGIYYLLFSPDGKHCAYMAGKGKKSLVVVDGKAHPAYEGVAKQSFTFSPDSQHFAYVVQENGQQSVVLDGKPGRYYQGVAGIVFSGDSQHLVHYAGKDGKQAPVLDRVEQGWYEKTGDFQLDHAGKTLLFMGGGEGFSYLTINGQKASDTYEDLYNLKVTPDGRRTACFAQRNGRWHVLTDGQESPPFQDVGTGTLEWNAARGHWQCMVIQNGRNVFLEGGKLGRPYDDVCRRPPQISPAGKVAYGATRNGKWFIVLDGLESEPLDRALVGPGFRGETMHALVVRGDRLERITSP